MRAAYSSYLMIIIFCEQYKFRIYVFYNILHVLVTFFLIVKISLTSLCCQIHLIHLFKVSLM